MLCFKASSCAPPGHAQEMPEHTLSEQQLLNAWKHLATPHTASQLRCVSKIKYRELPQDEEP
eukprot:7820625-Alexandrium_andersonii.AAC.1